MSIQSEIDRLNNAKAEIAEAISEKGVAVPTGTSFDGFPALVRGIPQEGGSGDSNVTVTFDMDISTISASNFSHTYDEIVALLSENKNILAKGNFGFGYCFGQLVAFNAAQSVLLFQIMLQFNFGDGTKLYYFSLILTANNSITVNPYIVNLTSMGG